MKIKIYVYSGYMSGVFFSLCMLLSLGLQGSAFVMPKQQLAGYKAVIKILTTPELIKNYNILLSEIKSGKTPSSGEVDITQMPFFQMDLLGFYIQEIKDRNLNINNIEEAQNLYKSYENTQKSHVKKHALHNAKIKQ